MRIISRHATQDLTSGEMSARFDFDNSIKLLTVYVHATAPLIEDITISFQSREGSSYNTVIADRTLESETCYVYTASGIVAMNEQDSLLVEVTNANSTGSIFCTVKAETDY